VAESRVIEQLVHRILSGKLIFKYKDIIYCLHKPSLDLKLESDILYKDIYESSLFDDFWLIEDIPNLAIELGLLSFDHNQQISRIEKKLENSKLILYQQYLDINKKKKNRINLEQIKKQLNIQYHNLHCLDYLSLEHYCEKIKNEFLITHTLYYFQSDKLVFDSNYIEYNFFNEIISQISNEIISVETYKEIARHEYWRNYWSNNKSNILTESVDQWSDEQKTLMNISTMYDRVHEHPEAPPEEIIADDDALDGWMIDQKKKNIKQKQEKGVDNMLTDKIRNSSEIFLMASNKETADTILDFNTDQSLYNLKQKVSVVTSQDKAVPDSHLPDVRQKIHEQIKGI
jgi:hypothetical protein